MGISSDLSEALQYLRNEEEQNTRETRKDMCILNQRSKKY